MDRFMSGLAALYELGVNLSVERLYPRVEWPVARNTAAINSLIKWDHRKPIRDRIFPERWSRRNGADANVEINCGANDYRFYLDHSVDGQPILAATGYLLLAWRKLAYDQGKLWHQVPVVFENVQFKRAVFLSEDSITKLTVKYYPLTGDFCIYENENVCVSGKMRAPAGDDALSAQHTLLDGERRLSGAQYSLQTYDIYTELRIIGLEYGQAFQRLRRVGTDDYRVFYGRCQWDGNFVTYMDALLQSRALSVPFRKMLLPVLIRKLTIDPRVMFDAFNRNKCGEEGVEGVEGVKPTVAPIASNPSQVNIDVANEMGELGLYTNDQTVPIVSAPAVDTAKTRYNHRFSQYSSEITFHFNCETKQLVAPGVELEEVIVAPVARRHDTTGLVLDTDEFYANDDNHAIDHCLSAAMAKYLQVCKSLAVKVKQLGFAEMKCDFNYENLGEEVIQEFRKECNENHVMFRTEYDMSKDAVNQIQRNERMIRALVEIVCENCVTNRDFTEPEIAFMSLTAKPIPSNNELDLRIKTFQTIATKTGLNLIAAKCDTIGTMCLLFRKIIHKPVIPAKHNVIQVNRDYRQWFGVLQEKQTAGLDADKTMDTVWLLAQDSSINGIIGLMNCLRLEPGGKKFRYIFNMDTNNDNTVIDFNSKPYSDILANDLAANVIKEGKVGTYRHFKVVADYDKCVSNDYYLNSGAKKDLTGIEWFDSRKIPEIKTFYTSDNKEVRKTRVEIYCAGISFHEVMLASGRITPGAEQLFTDCLLGCEYVGRRVDTGERVMGIDTHRTFATSVNASIHSMTTIPEHWSMAEAATIVGTYCTLYYALIKRANLKQGESILIHSAAGGVGQAAINMCRHYGCDIYATVGTAEKKEFLMNKYNIPADRIFNSRDIAFKNQLLQMTAGNGVDIVLNSLSGEKLDASYQCVANSGRFVELGRYDMLENKQLGMFDFVRNIQFIGVVIDMVILKEIDFFVEYFHWVRQNSTNGCVKPINYTLFEAREADKAFRYMTTGKHMGKVALKMRDEEINRRPLIAIKPAVDMVTTVKTFFDPNKVYIITGGLGGFGLELVPWMQFFGARKFVTTSRSGLRTDYQKFIYNRFLKCYAKYKAFDCQWVVSTADGFTIDGTRQLLREAQELGPIGGVFHLALELSDCLLENMTLDRFRSSFETKYTLFTNLDQLSRQLDYPLDYFVVFSSIACGKGSSGQTNYAYGNSLCERICEERRRDGLHGLAIQYGPIDDVGAFVGPKQMMAFTSVQKQRIYSCCHVLDKLLAIKQPVVTSHVQFNARISSRESGSKEARVVGELWRALGIDPEVTPDHLTLGEIGLESMFAVELQTELEREYAIRFSLNYIKSITIGMLKAYESGDINVIKRYVNELKSARLNLLRQKFIMPTETHIRLNAVTTGRPVYLMPTMLLNFTMFDELVRTLGRPVIGLNWTREMSAMTTLKQVNEHYAKLLRQLEPRAEGGYDVVGYLDGAIAAGKLARKGAANRAVIIDIMGANERLLDGDQLTDTDALGFTLDAVFCLAPADFRLKIMRDVSKETDTIGRVRRVTAEFAEFAGKGLQAPDIDEICHVLLARLRMFLAYRAEKRKKLSAGLKTAIVRKWSKRVGKVSMIKPVMLDGVNDVDALIAKSRDAYLLPAAPQGDDKANADIEVTIINSMPTLDPMNAEMNEKILAALK
ncbi:unnamed protein product [Medioppia subpectinata]|uniref:PKS/mFAS DH domain-containing protein n=1 Tax=Medioppia subpectinata TaxID=1979941 RepID=A0A7R9Q208_9ACAR|nr:unnamed protein product [Medioppia subpectinata]CAG2109810.1 unnamed protein product [Medioppia subpectinata]